MSQLVSRILLAIFLFPMAGILYLILFVGIEESGRSGGMNYRNRDLIAFIVAGIVTWIAVAAYWWMLWRSSVQWNSTRISRTMVAILIATGVGVVAGIVANTLMSNNDDSFGAFVGNVLAVLLWLIGTVFIWRETATERAGSLKGVSNTIACPTCGYNMTGLTESRCPECGSKFTLDELLALQPSRVIEVE